MKVCPDNSSFLQPLFDFMERFHPLSESFKMQYKKECNLLNVKKNKFILSPIDTNDAAYFLLKGVVRAFVKEDKKDISTRFCFENEFIEAIKHPGNTSDYSIEYLQALEDCRLIRIPYKLIDFLNLEYPESQLITRKLLESNYHAASERSILARIPTAMGRYLKFESDHSEMNRIPQRYLASYLVMRLETLSRMRNKAVDNRLQKMDLIADQLA